MLCNCIGNREGIVIMSAEKNTLKDIKFGKGLSPITHQIIVTPRVD